MSIPLLAIYTDGFRGTPTDSGFPSDLIKEWKLNLDEKPVIIVFLKDEKYIITGVCQHSINNIRLRQIFLSKTVIGGVRNIFELTKLSNSIIDNTQFHIAEIYKAKEIKINLISKSSQGGMKLKNYYHLSQALCNIIKCYGIKKGVMIDCTGNLSAERLDLAYIIVTNVLSIDPNDTSHVYAVFEVNSLTKIKVDNIESKDKLLSAKDKKDNALGGLDKISKKLSCFVMHPKLGSSGVYNNDALLIGPPGCGKTSLVKKVCQNTQVSLITTSDMVHSDEKSEFKSFLKICKRAIDLSKEGPCIFFIDEIDGLISDNVSKSRREDKLIASLQMYFKHSNLYVIAATNRLYDLNRKVKMLIQSNMINLGVPTLEQRQEILKVRCRDFIPSESPDLTSIAECTPGFVGADLSLLSEKMSQFSNSEDLTKTDKVNSFLDKYLSLADSIVPTLHKSLDFMVKKPKSIELGGLEQVKDILENTFFLPRAHRSLFTKNNFKIPKGVLLYGPRGCGKTIIAKYMASKRGCNFIYATASELLSQYVGTSEKNIAALFHTARITQPCIIFLDEIDGIFRTRDGNSVYTSINSELLQEMDGIGVKYESIQGVSYGKEPEDIQDDVIVVAATNHPNDLDPALLRSGRLDTLIYIPLPDRAARLDILKLKTRKMKIDDKSCLDLLADVTEGLTGAELENIVQKTFMDTLMELDRKGVKITEAPTVSSLRLLEEARHRNRSVSENDLEVYKKFSNTVVRYE